MSSNSDGTVRTTAPQAMEWALQACRELVETIDATGGIVYPECGLPYPAADPTWIDLVDPYVKAKAAINMIHEY